MEGSVPHSGFVLNISTFFPPNKMEASSMGHPMCWLMRAFDHIGKGVGGDRVLLDSFGVWDEDYEVPDPGC
jgi:hypothetical protein